MQSTDFVVTKHDLQQCKLIETALPEALPSDALLVKVDRFAFTVNNITYATLGDEMKYWQLFPAPRDFGNIPVWGFGKVMASKHPDVAEGERLFGYFPMRPATSASGPCATSLRIGRACRRSIMCTHASVAIPPSPDRQATTRRCSARCSCCRSWSMIFLPRMSSLAHAA